MIRSMTGFGAASAALDGARYVVELRSLNSKFFKALIRLPEELQGLEAELEPEMSGRLTRGSVVLTVRFSDTSAEAAAQINGKALGRYLEQLRAVCSDGQLIDVAPLLSLPGVLMTGTGEELLERTRPVLKKLVG